MNRATEPFPFVIIRLWPRHHAHQVELAGLLAALKRNRRACDEVWFCTEIGFPPMDAHERSALLMAGAAEKIRALGIEPGLQIANTLGHGMSLLRDESGAVWPPMVDEEGRTAPPAPCPRAPIALAYLDRMVRLYAACQPSSIWIDDDLRMSSHGALKYGCFCPLCVHAFSVEQRRKFTRSSLVAALHDPSDGALRLAWTRFNAASLAGIAAAIARAAHAVAPAAAPRREAVCLVIGESGPRLQSGLPGAPALRIGAGGRRGDSAGRRGGRFGHHGTAPDSLWRRNDGWPGGDAGAGKGTGYVAGSGCGTDSRASPVP
jgi:hypothetical protein